MFKAIIVRGGKWRDNLYTEECIYGDFQNLKDAIKWITEEYAEFRDGWAVIRIVIEEKEM